MVWKVLILGSPILLPSCAKKPGQKGYQGDIQEYSYKVTGDYILETEEPEFVDDGKGNKVLMLKKYRREVPSLRYLRQQQEEGKIPPPTSLTPSLGGNIQSRTSSSRQSSGITSEKNSAVMTPSEREMRRLEVQSRKGEALKNFQWKIW